MKRVSSMKYLVIIGDGMADHPIPSLGGNTPLESARTPNMDGLAMAGKSGLAVTVPRGMPPGSDVANLAVMGYDPSRYYSGRAPLEAAAMGIRLAGDDVAFRCNFVTIKDGVMEDYSAGHISSGEGKELTSSLRSIVPGGRLYSGVSYRNIMVINGAEHAVCTPPHDITGRSVDEHMPRGKGADKLLKIMADARSILASHPVNVRRIEAGKRPANSIWLWGQGRAPSLPTLADRFQLSGAVISAVDLLKGIGSYAGMEVIEVPGATGTIDTNYEGKVDAALDALGRADLVYLHIEAPDEAAHEGDALQKIRAIEKIDQRVVGRILEGLKNAEYRWRILLMPDHPTPIEIRTHTSEPVPFVIAGDLVKPDDVKAFNEESAAHGGFGTLEGSKLLDIMIKEESL